MFKPNLVIYDSERPVAIIPGIAIHMQRDANSGWKIDRQKELMPVTGLSGAAWTEGAFAQFLAGELDVDESEILSYDLNLYNFDEPQLVGITEELVSSPRLDNLASVSALLEALVEGERSNGINLIGLFNHEEVGSFTRSGADSELLGGVLEGIFRTLGCDKEMYRASMAGSVYLSVDGAHGATRTIRTAATPHPRLCGQWGRHQGMGYLQLRHRRGRSGHSSGSVRKI